MCTMICEQTKIEGSGKGSEGWFPLNKVNVSYDHPFNAPGRLAGRWHLGRPGHRPGVQ